MYIKIVVLFLLFCSSSFATNYEINDIKVFEDKNSNYDIYKILKNKKLFKKSKKTNLGTIKHDIWTVFKIKNDNTKIKNLILSNPRAGIDFIDVYLVAKDKVVKTILLGDMTEQKKRDFVYRKSSFLLDLNPLEEFDMYVRYKSFGAIDINWQVHDQTEYLSYITKESLVFGFIAGFIILISSYIFFIDRITPLTSNKIYFGIIISSLLVQFSIAGVFYQLGLNSYLNTIFSWSIGNFGAALVGLFPIYFFNLKKIMPKATFLLKLISFSLIAFAVIFLFYPLKNELLYLSSYANIILILQILFLFYISIHLTIKKIKGYFFYLLANTFFTSSILYFLLGLFGFVKISGLFYFSLGIGAILNILCIGLLIVNRIFVMKEEKEKALFLLSEHAKLSNVGQAMINISHQWKEPINHIYYAINNVYAAKEFKDPRLNEIIEESLEQIKTTTTHMANTGKNFLSLYEDKSHIEDIEISNEISSTIKILKNQIDSLNIRLITKYHDKETIHVDKYLFSNVILIILENSIKVFKNKKVKKPFIKIHTMKKESQIFINITDNAEGINIHPINSIFEKDLTSLESTGLGLFLAKNILTMKLNGNISVKNTKNGACFQIVLNT